MGQFQIGGLTLTWKDQDSYTVFSYSHRSTLDLNNYYIAFAFSTDQKMGGDNVVSCMVTNGRGSVAHMYNAGKSAPQLLDSADPSVGLVNASISNANGLLTCSLMRLKANSNYINYYNLNNAFYLLVAHGSMVSGVRSASAGLKADSTSKTTIIFKGNISKLTILNFKWEQCLFTRSEHPAIA
jgi:hypothetical protein